jgi:nitrite reductase/ring-hydroxylating ferredoxin subunit
VTSDVKYVSFCHELPLEEGGMAEVFISGKSILVCRTREGVFAVDGICTHAYARLREGRLRGNRIICPLHGASFDVRSGKVLGLPAIENLGTYRVRISAGAVEVEEPKER